MLGAKEIKELAESENFCLLDKEIAGLLNIVNDVINSVEKNLDGADYIAGQGAHD